jgi:hypothetical protein
MIHSKRCRRYGAVSVPFASLLVDDVNLGQDAPLLGAAPEMLCLSISSCVSLSPPK